MEKPLTYISLFSSAGVGCYGFKMEGFECIATNEIIPRRLNIQKYNQKCKYDSGYICGDITLESTKRQIRDQILLWQKNENISDVDVLIATPPCQGMSVANHKKSDKEIIRNSLVVESIKMIAEIRPSIFVFENVPAFMNTVCTDLDGENKPISEAIQRNLGEIYSYATRIINFKDYGACSSRSRTLVIGVRKDLADDISPYELFPDRKPEKTLREVIGHLPRLNTPGEISHDDIYHAFREYPSYMRSWIHDLKEGESAFDNTDPMKRPHQIKNGIIIENAKKNGDKYRRQIWDKPGPCVHTRNDQLASQNTIHPCDDRVFSIKELMLMMTIPYDFKWSEYSLTKLNSLSTDEKGAYLKKEEIKIRQCIGEAVPTEIFRSIAKNIKHSIIRKTLASKDIYNLLSSDYFTSFEKSLDYFTRNPDNLSLSCLMRVAEFANTKRTENAAYYTNQRIITEIMKSLPDTSGDTIRILEPSVGVGGFLPQIIKRFDSKRIEIDVVDIDSRSLDVLKALLNHMKIPDSVTINFICDDFLLHDFENRHYDYVIGNPPFGKISNRQNLLKSYKQSAVNKDTNNICSFFLDKCLLLGDCVSLVLPKSVLNAPEFSVTRQNLSKMSIKGILDFGENGFKGVLVETISLILKTKETPGKTIVFSMTNNKTIVQKQKYICDSKLPYWVIYRDEFFDKVFQSLTCDVFTVFRDRQITNSILRKAGDIRVIKSRNISNDGTQIINIPGYDSYANIADVENLAVYQYINNDFVYLTPNMTYYPRVIKKPAGVIVNGSVAILIPKSGIVPTETQLKYFATDEYRYFYKIARNFQTRSLNIDACSVYFFGLKKEE